MAPAAEIFNSVIEALLRLSFGRHNEKIKATKDTAAACDGISILARPSRRA